MNLIGHQTIKDQFSRLINTGTLSHAYILLGPNGVGKRALTEWIIGNLLNINITEILRHPDVKIIERAYDEKNERFKRDLTVNEIRNAIQFASESSFQGGYKIIVITEADRLNTEAGNALLKILEEPPAKTIFFLLYQTMGAIMPTIKSRSQIFTLGLVPEDELKTGLLAAGYEQDKVNEVSALANGRPGLAVTWLNEPEELVNYQQNQTECLELFSLPLSERFLRAEKWLAESKESGGTEELINLLTGWQMALSPYKILHSGTRAISLPDLTLIHDELAVAITALRQNSHPRLTLEVLLSKLP